MPLQTRLMSTAPASTGCMNKLNWKEVETIRKVGSKRYRERIAEQQEAEELIKNYKEEKEEFPVNDDCPKTI